MTTTAPATQALTIKPPRFAYLPELKDKYEIDEEAWRALVEAIFPNAQNFGSIILALAYCKSRNLDIFKRNVHIVPIWDKDKRCLVDTIWPGIGELRTTAFRTKQYAGRDATNFGEDVTSSWGSGRDALAVTHPEWAQVTVYRMIDGQRVAFAGPPVFWLETFAATKDGFPNSMWVKRPRGQIDKCAEAAALRAAFPEELGDTPTSDEGPMIYQNGAQALNGAAVDPAALEAGVAGCKDRMRKAIESVQKDAPAEEPPETDGPPWEQPGEGGDAEPVPDLLSEVAKLETQAPKAQVWQCEKNHTFETPEPREGTTLGVCPKCGTVRIRRLS
ncbi:MAG: phage recombination protein Bet [Planctomycetes bacterium]|nr:phage recombination protein Bet [Planctomycetota bacterium]